MNNVFKNNKLLPIYFDNQVINTCIESHTVIDSFNMGNLASSCHTDIIKLNVMVTSDMLHSICRTQGDLANSFQYYPVNIFRFFKGLKGNVWQ